MSTKNKLIICVGISGSGKTSWSSQYIKDNPNTLRINRDDIRKTLVGDLEGYYQRKDLNSIEEIVTDLEDDIFDSLIRKDKIIIIDNTNLKQSYINKWLKAIKEYEELCEVWEEEGDIEVQFKLFDIDSSLAEFRVMNRDETLDTEYIQKQYLQYQEIKKWLLTNYKSQII